MALTQRTGRTRFETSRARAASFGFERSVGLEVEIDEQRADEEERAESAG